ncbi:hypothetical protein [Insolitispirillum peregrinum]|uniref:hypothetical protein n=1 Tax=Insolitispirillum peregrinum TaxID=80876 RepID=UPI00361F74E5
MNITPDRHSMKSVFLALTSLLAISTAHAEDAPQGCAPVEGTWYSTYLIPGLGPADRLYHAPTEGPLITLRIEGNKATTTSFNGIKKIYSVKKYPNSNIYSFGGIAKDKETINATTEYKYTDDFTKKITEEDRKIYNGKSPCFLVYYHQPRNKYLNIYIMEKSE